METGTSLRLDILFWYKVHIASFFEYKLIQLTNKGASLPVGIAPTTSPPDLERMLYNQDALAPYSPSVTEGYYHFC